MKLVWKPSMEVESGATTGDYLQNIGSPNSERIFFSVSLTDSC